MPDTGFVSPSLVANDGTIPNIGDQFWNDATNAQADDSTFADADTISGANPTTEGLRAEFSFSIPAGSVIDGIEVRVKILDAFLNGTGNAWINTAVLSDGAGSSYGTTKSNLEIDFDGTNSFRDIIGSPTDLWGADGGGDPIDADKVNASGFGVAIQVERATGALMNVDPNVDVIQMRVYYSSNTITHPRFGGTIIKGRNRAIGL